MERKKTNSKDKKAEKVEVNSLKAASKLLPGLGKLLGFFAKPVVKVNRKSIKQAPNIPVVKQIKQLRGIDDNKKQKARNNSKTVNKTAAEYVERSQSGAKKFSTSAKHSSQHSKVDFQKFRKIIPTAADLKSKTQAMKSVMNTVKPNGKFKKAAKPFKPSIK